jgi:hypothetical protein
VHVKTKPSSLQLNRSLFRREVSGRRDISDSWKYQSGAVAGSEKKLTKTLSKQLSSGSRPSQKLSSKSRSGADSLLLLSLALAPNSILTYRGQFVGKGGGGTGGGGAGG